MSFLIEEVNGLKLNSNVTFGLETLAPLVIEKEYKSLILVTSPSFVRRGITRSIIEELFAANIYVLSNVTANPRIEEIETQFNQIRSLKPDALIALGGGSVIDTAKALSRRFSLSSTMTLMRYLQLSETVKISPSIPIIAIPTTSGTGSEVTPFASVWSQKLCKKFSVSGADLVPSDVVLDPRLTDTLPKEVTISSGLDTVSHALESLWNKNRTEDSRNYAIKSLELSMSSLPNLMCDLNNKDSRDKMMLSSFLGGLAIAQTKTALAHSISYPLTANLGVPHGMACSFALPQILEFNAKVAHKDFFELSIRFGFGGVWEFSESLQNLLYQCNLPEEFPKYLSGKQEIFKLVDQMQDPTRAGNNLREAGREDIIEILEEATAKLSLN